MKNTDFNYFGSKCFNYTANEFQKILSETNDTSFIYCNVDVLSPIDKLMTLLNTLQSMFN